MRLTTTPRNKQHAGPLLAACALQVMVSEAEALSKAGPWTPTSPSMSLQPQMSVPTSDGAFSVMVNCVYEAEEPRASEICIAGWAYQEDWAEDVEALPHSCTGFSQEVGGAWIAASTGLRCMELHEQRFGVVPMQRAPGPLPIHQLCLLKREGYMYALCAGLVMSHQLLKELEGPRDLMLTHALQLCAGAGAAGTVRARLCPQRHSRGCAGAGAAGGAA